MTTKQALKCIEEDFKVIEGSWQAQAVSRIKNIINRIEDIVLKYDFSYFNDFNEDEIKDLSFNDIFDIFTELTDDISSIKFLLL